MIQEITEVEEMNDQYELSIPRLNPSSKTRNTP